MNPHRIGTRPKTLTYADAVRTLNDKAAQGDIDDAPIPYSTTRRMNPHRIGTRPKTLTYADAVRTLNDKAAQGDIDDACTKLAHAVAAMMTRFDAIAKQLHTVDLLRRDQPMKPRWEALRKKLADVLWQYRNNAGMISGRLKLLSTAVLPMTARSSQERSTRPSSAYNEGLQVLGSYMNISETHFELSKALVDQSLKLTSDLIAFLTEFTTVLSRHHHHAAVKGQKEMCDLSLQLAELANHVERLVLMSRDTGAPDFSHLLFTSRRLVMSSGQPPGRSKLTRHDIAPHDGDIAKAYEHTERKRNEVIHAQYAAHLQHSPSDPLSSAHTALCALVLDELLITESLLNFFLAIRALLRKDCTGIFQWLRDPSEPATPMAILCYLESTSTLYAPLADGLDVFVGGLPEWVRAR